MILPAAMKGSKFRDTKRAPPAWVAIRWSVTFEWILPGSIALPDNSSDLEKVQFKAMGQDSHREARLPAIQRDGGPYDSSIGDEAVESRHARLKRHCAATHAAVEAAMEAGDFFATLEGYRRFLHGTYCFYLAFEQWADGVGVEHVLADWSDRRKTKLLIKDRGALGLTIDAAQAEMAIARIMQFDGERATLLGALYVTEGATLGAGLLARRAVELGLTSDRGAAFLGVYGRSKRRKWAKFLEVLESTPIEEARFAEVEEAALRTFDAYYKTVIRS